MRRVGEVGAKLGRGGERRLLRLPPTLGARLGGSASRTLLWSFFCFFFDVVSCSFFSHSCFSASSIAIRSCALPRGGQGGWA